MTALGLILAAAGGGSSGFGGGGGGGFSGGGGGGGFSGGRGGNGVYIGGGAVSGWFILAVFVAFFAFFAFAVISTWLTVRRLRRRLDERDTQVRTASAEAAEDDPAFAADRVTQDVTIMFHAIQGAWDARDEQALASLVGDDLMVEWHRRLTDFDRKGWHNRVRVISGPDVRYVGMTNRERDEEDRVVVHVAARLEDYVEAAGGMRVLATGDTDTVTDLREFWTLAKRDGRWILMSIEQDAEGGHHLDAPLVASPWADERLRDEALVEGAVADAALPGVATAELVDVDLAARRPRAGARPVARRRPLRPRRADRRRPARRRGVGRRRRRRRRAARGGRDARGGRRAALRRRRRPRHAASSSAARGSRPSRSSASTRRRSLRG